MRHDSGSINNVIADIRRDIKETQKRFLRELNSHIKEEKDKLKAKLKDEYNRMIQKGKQEIEQETAYLLEQNELQNQKQVLETQKELFDDFSGILIEKLHAFRKKKEYEALLKKQVEAFREKYKDVVIYCNQEDKDIFSKHEAVPMERDMVGIILEDKQKTVRLDLTFRSFFNQNKHLYSKEFYEKI